MPAGSRRLQDTRARWVTASLTTPLPSRRSSPTSRITTTARYLTVYFPAGTYKITQTLRIDHVTGVSLIGCGSDTKISWAGAAGGAMYWPSATGNMRYLGLTWLGNNLAAAAYEECSYQFYSGGIRHENESFHDFTAKATYIISGWQRQADHHAGASRGSDHQRLSGRADR